MSNASPPATVEESIGERLERLTLEIGQLAHDTRINVETKRAAWDTAVAQSFEVEAQATRLRAEIRSANRSSVQGALPPRLPRPLRDGMI
jgi:hypothetical protein